MAARDMQQGRWGASGGVDAHGSSGDSSVDQEMRCLGVAVALYDYAAQADDELTLTEGDTLYVDQLADEAWYKARLRDGSHEGLVPANYVEMRAPEQVVVAAYDYEAQNHDELSFAEGRVLDVLERDGDWLLARIQGTDQMGLIPSNYVEEFGSSGAQEPVPASEPSPEAEPAQEHKPEPAPEPEPANVPSESPAAQPPKPRMMAPPPPAPAPVTAPAPAPAPASAPAPAPTPPQAPEAPASVPLPSSLVPQATGAEDDLDETDGQASTVAPRAVPAAWTASSTQDEIQMWSVTELDMKKRKRKNKGTLGVGNGSVFFATDTDGAAVPRVDIKHLKSTTLEKGKYLIITFERAAQVEGDVWVFHVGSRAAYQDISARIGKSKAISKQPAHTASTPRVSSSAPHSPPTQTGVPEMVVALYDFEAQADDELSVSEGDQLVLIEREDHEWWKLQNAKGHIGVVPASYVEVLKENNSPALNALNHKFSTMRDPRRAAPRRPTEAKRHESAARPLVDHPPQLPNQGRMRTWVDATGRFRVEAELVGVRTDTVRLHKANGTLIDVPLFKMSLADLRYLEGITGRNLRTPSGPPSAASQRQSASGYPERSVSRSRGRGPASSYRPDIDWFDFFVEAGVDMQHCARYADAFERDHMDTFVLPELSVDSLRRLGLREGDILRVRRHVQNKYSKSSAPPPMPQRSPEEEEKQKETDEELARRLQAQEIAEQRRLAPRKSTTRAPEPAPEPLPPRSTDMSRNTDDTSTAAAQEALQPNQTGVSAETIAAAVEIIRRREREEAEEREKAAKKDERPADPNSALFDKLEKLKPSPKPSATPSMPDPNAPRGPIAPVPINQSLLQPLIPLQGTGQFVPTNPTGATSMFAPQPPGFGMPQPTGMFSVPQPQAPQPVPQPMLGQATADTTSASSQQDRFSAASVFEQMKTGSGAFSKDTSAPQSSGKYDPLRAQPTGFAAGGIVDSSPFGGGMMMPQGMPTQSMMQMPMGTGMMMGMPGQPSGFMPAYGFYPS